MSKSKVTEIDDYKDLNIKALNRESEIIDILISGLGIEPTRATREFVTTWAQRYTAANNLNGGHSVAMTDEENYLSK